MIRLKLKFLVELVSKGRELVSKVCGGAGVYGQGAGDFRQNQKYGIAQDKV